MWRGSLAVGVSFIVLGAGPAFCQSSAGAVVEKYCIACHNAQARVAGLSLDPSEIVHVADNPAIWEKVARKLRTREMPPPGLPRPDAVTYVAATAEVESALDAAAAAQPKPGHIPVHRMNRAEYVAAVRDLLALEVDGKALLPSDDADQEGFENVAAVLSISPALLENYLAAARTISRLAVGDPTINPGFDTFKTSKTLFQEEQMSDDLPFGSQGGVAIPYYFPLDSEYTIKVLLRRQEYDYIEGIGEPQQLDIRLDGVLLQRLKVGGEAKGRTMPESFAGNTQGDPEFEDYMHTADANLEVRVPVDAGEHTVGISFVRRFWEPEGVLQPPITGFGRSTNELYHGYPAVEIVNIGGPFGSAEPGDTASRRRVFVCSPSKPAQEEPCARKILSALAARAYRRPVTKSETEMLLDFYRQGREGQGFDEGVRLGIERILAAPSFLFRVHRQPAEQPPGAVYSLNDLDLATRLSFFLWSSIPDHELMNAAVRGDLGDPAQLERQVLRMLRDPRSQALVDNFAYRWLELNKLAGITPDSLGYPEFDENLRDAMKQETTLFVASQLSEDRRVTELITADYSYLNERLAKHYGIPNIYGSHFRRVSFQDGVRGGLLTNASILSVTSYPTRTSVVMRGRWLLANILGAPPPPPPPDIPPLEEAGVAGQPRSLRERMELHRKNPACASCHQRMDPLGFALENFDALGKWRDESDGAPIDASSSLPDGTSFNGAPGLRELLGQHEEDFVRTLTEKLLGHAIGRGIDYADMPAVRKIVRDAAPHDYRWSAIVLGIVKSTPFRMGSVGADTEQQLAQELGPTRSQHK